MNVDGTKMCLRKKFAHFYGNRENDGDKSFLEDAFDILPIMHFAAHTNLLIPTSLNKLYPCIML